MSDAVIGPWPGSNRLGVVPRRQRRPRPLPQRVRVGKHGPVVLMYCTGADCKKPWAPGTDIPRDRLCGECRAARAYGKYALFDTDPKGV